MSEELKPCPFCGGSACLERGFSYDYDGGDRWYVYSADVVCSCGCTLHVDNTWPKEYVSEERSLDFAIAAWNRRATDEDAVLQSIDQLRRYLNGYHDQLKAYNDLAKHCENQRRRIGELEGLFANAKLKIAELEEKARWIEQTDARWSAAVRDLEQANAENAELRERVKGFLGQRDERLSAAETRCNKLRELVRGFMGCPHHVDLCKMCEHARVIPKSVTGNRETYICRLAETCGNGDAWAECSVCGALLAVLTDMDKMPNYCPNCGAKVVQR